MSAEDAIHDALPKSFTAGYALAIDHVETIAVETGFLGNELRRCLNAARETNATVMARYAIAAAAAKKDVS